MNYEERAAARAQEFADGIRDTIQRHRLAHPLDNTPDSAIVQHWMLTIISRMSVALDDILANDALEEVGE